MDTIARAWFVRDDANRGSLVAGKLADLAVLSADYLTVPVGKIGEIHSMLTLIGGRPMYAEGQYQRIR